MANNDKSGVVVLGKADKKKKFNPELKNTMSSVVGGAGEASMPNSAPAPTGGMAASGGAVMASVSNDLFLSFVDSLKTPDNASLIESVKRGYKVINEAYEDVYTPEDDGNVPSDYTTEYDELEEFDGYQVNSVLDVVKVLGERGQTDETTIMNFLKRVNISDEKMADVIGYYGIDGVNYFDENGNWKV